MVGRGVLTGLAFPLFVTLIGVAPAPRTVDAFFRTACSLAGILVGRRLRHLAGAMHHVGDIVRSATATGDWSALQVARCHVPVDTDDELAEAAAAFNALLTALDLNVAERRRLEDRLRHQAFHDPLTGLANRALFFDRAGHALTRVRRDDGHLALLFLDLDRFKTINDTLGHAAGDAVLQEVARRLRAACRATDTVTRLGGDEFAVLLEDFDASSGHHFAAHLGAVLRAPHLLGDQRVVIHASIGIAVGHHHQRAGPATRRRPRHVPGQDPQQKPAPGPPLTPNPAFEQHPAARRDDPTKYDRAT